MSEPMFKTKAKTIHIHQDKNTLYDKDVKFTKNREEHIVLEFDDHRFELDKVGNKQSYEESDTISEDIMLTTKSGHVYSLTFEDRKDYLDAMDWLKNCSVTEIRSG